MDAFINEHGFAILPSGFSPERMVGLLGEVKALSPPRSRAGVRHALRLRPVAEISVDPQLLTLVCGVLGPKAFPFRATLFEKSSEINWLVVWHQDTALPMRTRRELAGWGPWSIKAGVNYAHAPADALSQVLALRIHLDDSLSENGPLRVLPGTHTLGVLSDDQLHELGGRVRPVDCVVPRGGIVAMRPLLVHASSKSHNEKPRRVLHIEYATSESIASPLELAIA